MRPPDRKRRVPSMNSQANNPLHGLTLEAILTRLDNSENYTREIGERGLKNLGPFTPQAHLTRYLEIVEEEKSRPTR